MSLNEMIELYNEETDYQLSHLEDGWCKPTEKPFEEDDWQPAPPAFGPVVFFYLNDNMKPFPKMTLNCNGVRYEITHVTATKKTCTVRRIEVKQGGNSYKLIGEEIKVRLQADGTWKSGFGVHTLQAPFF